MFNLKEYSYRRDFLADHLPWAAMVEDGLVLNKDGSLLRTFRYRGRDLASSTATEMMIAVAQLNNVLRRLNGSWAMFIEARRDKALGYPDREFPDKITAMFDAERRSMFSSGENYESSYYFTLVYMPPKDKYDKLGNVFYDTDTAASTREHRRIEENKKAFKTEYSRVYAMLLDVMSECKELGSDEILTYLHSTVSLSPHPVKTPPIPICLDCLLADTPFTGGLYPKLGNSFDKKHLAIISVLGFPSTSRPGILDELNRLNIEYRWVTRYIPLDKVDAASAIKKIRREWFAGRKSMFTMIKETITKSESAMLETANLERSADAEVASNELDVDICSFGYYCTEVIILDTNDQELNLKAKTIQKTIENKGFTAKREDLNAVGAWFSSIPGHTHSNVRWPLISSMNLAHFFPLSSVWAGEKTCKHLNAPSLMQTVTTGSTPFRFNLHVGEVGHTMVVGPTGSGKSVLLNTLEAQFRSFPKSKIYIFDKGGSCRALTAGVGGEFYDLAAENATSLSFQPLANIDQESEKIWASEWLQQIYEYEKVILTPSHKTAIWNALTSLASTTKDERTLSGFYILIQNQELKEAISPYITKIGGMVESGPYGNLFGSNIDNLRIGSWQAFEMEELMQKKAAVMPTLQYLFHVIEKNCDGSPTMIVLDECWVFLDNPIFAAKIREWLKVMRKNNVAVVFATQNLSDVANSSIAPAILESCFTRLYLPNPQAITPSEAEIYTRFNLNETERMIIATAIPKRQYYYKSVLGCRLFELALTPFALAYIASASKEDQAMVKNIQTECPNDDFNEHWLEYKNQPDALNFYRNMQ